MGPDEASVASTIPAILVFLQEWLSIRVWPVGGDTQAIGQLQWLAGLGMGAAQGAAGVPRMDTSSRVGESKRLPRRGYLK